MPTPSRSDIESAIRIDCLRLGLDPEICLRQCDTESDYNPTAYNPRSDCFGLFQLSKVAAREVDVDRYYWRDNITGGTKYLARMLKRFGGDYAKALAAYNYGPTVLTRLIKKWGDKWRLHLPVETRGYLKKILPPPSPKKKVV